MLRKAVKALAPPVVWDVLSTLKNGHAPSHRSYQSVTTSHNMRDLDEGAFGAAFNRHASLDPHTQADDLRLRHYFACFFAQSVLHLPGDFLSAGISYGVAPRVIYDFTRFDQATPRKRFHLIDPFTGTHESGQLSIYNTDADYVRAQYPKDAPVLIHEALLPDCFPLPGLEALAFVHLNTGAVAAEAASLAYLYERLSPGGIIIIDKYAFGEGYFAGYEAAIRKTGASVFSMVTGQGILIKSPAR